MAKEQSFLGFMFSGPKVIAEINEAIVRAVAVSYHQEGGTRTDAADRERVRKCVKWVRVMRGDMHWSVPRIVDELPRALCADLRGEAWEPEKGKAWAGDNAPLIVDPTTLRHTLPE